MSVNIEIAKFHILFSLCFKLKEVKMKNLEQLNNFIKLLLGIACDCWAKRTSISSKDIETCNGVVTNDEATKTYPFCVTLNKRILSYLLKQLSYCPIQNR